MQESITKAQEGMGEQPKIMTWLIFLQKRTWGFTYAVYIIAFETGKVPIEALCQLQLLRESLTERPSLDRWLMYIV